MSAARSLILGGILVIALAGCEKKAPAEGGGASRVLPGSASDAMIAYDTLRSQPPLAPEIEGSDAPARRGGPRAGGSDSADLATEPSAAASDAAPASPGEPAASRPVPPASEAP